MQHYTCDMCGKLLDEQRFVVTVQIYPAFDPEELTSADLDVDHLHEIAEIIAQSDPLDPPLSEEVARRELRYDLCPACRRRFAQDPLGKQSRQPIHFSEN